MLPSSRGILKAISGSLFRFHFEGAAVGNSVGNKFEAKRKAVLNNLGTVLKMPEKSFPAKKG